MSTYKKTNTASVKIEDNSHFFQLLDFLCCHRFTHPKWEKVEKRGERAHKVSHSCDLRQRDVDMRRAVALH